MGKEVKCRYRCNQQKLMIDVCGDCTSEDACINGAKSIFIVDDDRSQLTELYEIFSYLGYDCRHFSDSEAAIQKIGDIWCDILFTDIRMPGIDGIALAKFVQKEKLAELIILMSSTLSDHTLLSRGWLFFKKPIDVDLIHEEINRRLKRDRGSARTA